MTKACTFARPSEYAGGGAAPPPVTSVGALTRLVARESTTVSGPYPLHHRPAPPDGPWGVPLDAAEWHEDRALDATGWCGSRHMRSCQELRCHSLPPDGTPIVHSASPSGAAGSRGTGTHPAPPAHLVRPHRVPCACPPRTPDPAQAPEAGRLGPQATPSHFAREDRSAGGTTAHAASLGCPIPAVEWVCKACDGTGPTCGGTKHTCDGAGPMLVLHC